MPQRMDDHRQPQKTTFPEVLGGLRWGLWNTGLSEREAVWDPREDGGEVESGLGTDNVQKGKLPAVVRGEGGRCTC